MANPRRNPEAITRTLAEINQVKQQIAQVSGSRRSAGGLLLPGYQH